jgi:hypothetical protein
LDQDAHQVETSKKIDINLGVETETVVTDGLDHLLFLLVG